MSSDNLAEANKFYLTVLYISFKCKQTKYPQRYFKSSRGFIYTEQTYFFLQRICGGVSSFMLPALK